MPPVKGDKTVSQIPFDFAGLAEAYCLMPDVETVVIMPDAKGVGSNMPTEDGIECFRSADRKNPLLVTLEQYETKKYGLTVGLFLLKQRLEGLPAEKRSDFIRQTNLNAIELVLERMAHVVAAGGKGFLLLPESELPNLHPEDKTAITCLLPGIRIDHDRTWAARVDGKYAWLLEGVRPGLLFGGSDIYRKTLPHLALKSLPKKSDATALSGAVDRKGGLRAIYFRIGRGELIITSAVAIEPLLKRLGIVALADTEPPTANLAEIGGSITGVPGDAEPATVCTTPLGGAPALKKEEDESPAPKKASRGSVSRVRRKRRTNVKAEMNTHDESSFGGIHEASALAQAGNKACVPVLGTLSSMLPIAPEGIREWDVALHWAGGDKRQRTITSVVVLAHTLDSLSGTRKAHEKIPVLGPDHKENAGLEIRGEAIRTLLSNKIKMQDLPTNLQGFLLKARLVWNQRFINV